MTESKPNSKTMGKGMLIASWVIGLALLTQAFDWFEKARINPNQNPKVSFSEQGQAQLVLERNRFGHYLFDGQINGYSTTFLVDTGATMVAIPENQARQMGLQPMGQYRVQTANGMTTAYHTIIEQLQLGPFILRDVKASILPAMDGDQEVLLGMSALRYLSFSQREDRLILAANN